MGHPQGARPGEHSAFQIDWLRYRLKGVRAGGSGVRGRVRRQDVWIACVLHVMRDFVGYFTTEETFDEMECQIY